MIFTLSSIWWNRRVI